MLRVWVIVTALLTNLAGCGLMQSAQTMTRESMSMMKPKPHDYRDSTDESRDEWTEFGESARAMRPAEKDNDPLRNWLSTPKARSIERNLGVE